MKSKKETKIKKKESEIKVIPSSLKASVRKKIPTKGVDPKYLGIPNINFSLTDKDDKREPQFAYERKTKGYDRSELWSLDSTIARFIAPRLRDFAEDHCGYPACFADDKEWSEILDKMATAFELLSSDEFPFLTKEQDAQVEEGLDLFRKWFHSLWD